MVRWLVVIFLVVLALVRYELKLKTGVPYAAGDVVRVVGMVSDNQRVTVDNIEIQLPKGISLEYGDKVSVTGTLTNRLIKGRDMGFSLKYQSFSKIDNGFSLARSMGIIRKKLIERMFAWLPGDEGGLAVGILLGGTDLVSKQAQDDFKKVGMTYILVASGYNVSMASLGMMAVGVGLLGRRKAIWFGIVGVVLYMYLAGLGASVVRAGIMAIVSLVGLYFGRESDGGWLLVLTAVGMVAWNPEWMVDIGFQLSVAAMAGLIWLASELQMGFLEKLGGLGKYFQEALGVTLAAQVMTMPIILHYFGNLSVVAPVVNAALLWMVPLIMEVTAVGVIVGPVNWLAWPLLRLMLWVVREVARWPMSSWEVGKMSWWWVVVYYVAVGAWIYRKQYLKR